MPSDDQNSEANASEVTSANVGAVVPNAPVGHSDDRPVMAFVTGAATEQALRDGLNESGSDALEIHRGGIRGAIAAMRKKATVKVLIVDVSGEDQPLTSLGDLSHLVDSDVRVLVMGDINHVDFYREVTRGLGAVDYIEKPLTRDAVSRIEAVVLGTVTSSASQGTLRGRAVSITGVHGGVGATTIAVNLAWNYGVQMHRHTVLLDSDIHFGNASLMLNIHASPGFRMALEAPERIDTLLAERVAQTAADRLHVLASHEKVAARVNPAPGAANVLLAALRQRYNLIVADVPFRSLQFNRDLLELVDQRILVMTPHLSAVRDTLRMLELPGGERQSHLPIVVLNRAGMIGGLNLAQVETMLKRKADVVIADLPRQVGHAATFGQPAMQRCRRYRDSILGLTREISSRHDQ